MASSPNSNNNEGEKEKNLKVLLIERPKGLPEVDKIFQLQQEPIPTPTKEGHVLVRNIYLSLDPAMRGWMTMDTYIPKIPLGSVMYGACVGEVVQSKSSNYKVGDYVFHFGGWQKYVVLSDSKLSPVVEGAPLRKVMGVFGMTGLTAYFGMLRIGNPKPGETVLVSGASGATGSVAGFIAKIKGCRVVGIAGSDEKCKWLEQNGFDATINYKTTQNITQAVRQTCPEGVDVYFDNVGGEILDAALACMRMKGRVVLCGGISQYNAMDDKEARYGVKNLSNAISMRLLLQGFIVTDFADEFPEATKELVQWAKDGQLPSEETIVDGLENAPKTFLYLFTGQNMGKLLIRISPEKVNTPGKL